jgi:hypothetical protein
MLDKDLAMETACEKVLPNTAVYNCIWHAGRNRFQQLHKTLGVRWSAFKTDLMTTAFKSNISSPTHYTYTYKHKHKQ